MNVLIRQDWKTMVLVPGIKLGDCVVSSSFPQLAANIVPTESQAENAFMLAKMFFGPVAARFGKIIFDSWLRDHDLNKAVGGVGDSGHLLGSSSDFTCPDAKAGTVVENNISVPAPAMRMVYEFCLHEIDWPGELFFYKKRGHVHADMPRLGVWIDRKILDK